MKHINGSRSKASDPIDMVRDDIAAIKKDLAAVLSGHISSVGDRAKEVVARAGDGASEVVQSAKEHAVDTHERLGSFAGARPLTTIAIASAAGAAAATLMGWWSRRGD